MTILTGLLVGVHFNPPAKFILPVLPAGSRLGLEKEPTNPYDPEAVVVWLVAPEEIPDSQHERLAELLEGTGVELSDVLEGGPRKLGHLGAASGKPLKKAAAAGLSCHSNTDVLTEMERQGRVPDSIRLGFDPRSEPTVVVEWCNQREEPNT